MNVDPYYRPQKYRSITVFFWQYKSLKIFEGVSCWDVFKPECGRWNRRIRCFPVAISSYVSEITSALIAHYDNTPFWIPAGTNKGDLNDFECPIHIKVRLVDGTLDVYVCCGFRIRPCIGVSQRVRTAEGVRWRA